jgi:hypothetical protein
VETRRRSEAWSRLITATCAGVCAYLEISSISESESESELVSVELRETVCALIDKVVFVLYSSESLVKNGMEQRSGSFGNLE